MMNNLILLPPRERTKRLKKREILGELKQFDNILENMGGVCTPNFKDFLIRKGNFKQVNRSFADMTPTQLRDLFLLKDYIKYYESSPNMALDTGVKQETIRYVKFLRNFFEPFKDTRKSREVRDVIDRTMYMTNAKIDSTDNGLQLTKPEKPIH
jgi:hypothetical protein